jgi:glycosyltransferase involved in cell wall biosynthesis
VLHSHRYKENLLAWILSKVLRADRLISTIHGMPEPQLQRTALFARVKTRLNFALLRRCFYKTIAVSREMAAALVDNHKFSPDQVEVIYNGISLPEVPFRPYRSQTETAHVGTIGRMVPVKDYALFLKAAAEIRRNHTLVRFSILGNGPLAAQLKEQAVEIGLGGSIEFLTPRPDIAAHYGILDVYVNTSQHEGVPLTVLEAMANGVPVVAASVGGIREIIVHGQSGLLVESRNPKDFAAACIRLLEDSSLRESIRRNAYQRVRRVFGEDEMARRYKAVYESVCENS